MAGQLESGERFSMQLAAGVSEESKRSSHRHSSTHLLLCRKPVDELRDARANSTNRKVCRGNSKVYSGGKRMRSWVSASTNGDKGAVYGKCIAGNYQSVSKDMCAKEFMALKECYLVWQC